jgi:hypothetical protein
MHAVGRTVTLMDQTARARRLHDVPVRLPTRSPPTEMPVAGLAIATGLPVFLATSRRDRRGEQGYSPARVDPLCAVGGIEKGSP